MIKNRGRRGGEYAQEGDSGDIRSGGNRVLDMGDIMTGYHPAGGYQPPAADIMIVGYGGEGTYSAMGYR